MNELKDFFKKAFGKQNDSQSHAISMLIIYGIFIAIVIMVVRLNPVNNDTISKKEKIDNGKQEEINNNNSVTDNTKKNTKLKENDINYSYSYTITFDNEKEIYLGKKVDNKEKFSYIKNGVTLEYAIINDNYLLLKDGAYHITDALDTYFKYCDVEKITNMLSNKEYVLDNNKYVYNVDNIALSSMYSSSIKKNNNLFNKIEFEIENDNFKSIYLDYSNYISSVLGSEHVLNIKMEFANIGTTEDFDIKIN